MYLYINACSDLGSRMNMIAVSALLFTHENSAFWLMAYFVARQVGALLSSLYAGMLADRWDRRRLMMASDVLCGLSIGLVAVFPYPLVAVLAAFFVGMLYNVFQISFDASLPQLFGEGNVYATNSKVVRLGMLASLLGFMVGGFLADQVGSQYLIAFDAFTFILSATFLSRLRWNSAPVKAGAKPEWLTDLRIVASYLKDRPLYAYLMGIGFLYAFAATSWNYGLPLLSQTMGNVQSTMHGMMWTTIVAGGFFGSYLLGKVRFALIPALLVSMSLFALLISFAFWGSGPVVTLVMLFVAGCVDAQTQMAQRTLMQGSANHLRGRILGSTALLARIGFLLGFSVEPFLIQQFSLEGMVLAIQGAVLMSLLLLAVPMLRSARQTLPE